MRNSQILPPAVRVLAACARWPRVPADLDRIDAIMAGFADWPGLLGAVRRHRMAGMTLAGLDQARIALPPGVRRALVGMAAFDTRHMLTLVGAAEALQRRLGALGIAMRVLKGPPLAIAVYGDLAVRQCRDLDLLVDPADLPAAYRALLAAGYAPVEPAVPLSERALRLWAWLRQDIGLRSARSGVLVELHDRLSGNPHGTLRPPAAADFAPVDLGSGIRIDALRGDALILYLCVHGAHHGWMRLKWLADVAALLAGQEDAALERLYARARRDRVDLELGQAFLLCQRLFATRLPPTLETRLRRSRRIALIERMALGFLADPRELHGSRFGTTRLSLYGCLLGRSGRHFAVQALQASCDFRVAVALGGSRGALALSVLARPFAWLWRKATGSAIVAAPPREHAA